MILWDVLEVISAVLTRSFQCICSDKDLATTAVIIMCGVNFKGPGIIPVLVLRADISLVHHNFLLVNYDTLMYVTSTII